MDRTRPAVVALGVALLICLTGAVVAVGGAVPADIGSDVTPDHTTDQSTQTTPENVSPSSPITFSGEATESGTATADVDAGVATAVGLAEIEAEYNQALLDERLDRVPSAAAERSELRAQQDRVEQRVTRLRGAEQATYTGLASADRDPATVGYELARINGAAAAYDEWVTHIEQKMDDVDGIEPDRQLGALLVETATLQSPLRNQLMRTATGADERKQLYVTAGSNGLLLGTNADGTFYRDAYDGRLYDQDAEIAIDEIEVLARVDEQYPWITEFDSIDISQGLDTPNPNGAASRVHTRHPHGELITFVNRENGDVFFEHQELDHDSVPTTERINTTDDGLQLTVEETFPTGPMKVTLLDGTSGEPLQGTIRIDEQVVGTTDENGQVWIVDSPEERTLSATVATNRIAVQLDGTTETVDD